MLYIFWALESMHVPFRFQILKRIWTFYIILFLNEYTHVRKCVCLDTRLVRDIGTRLSPTSSIYYHEENLPLSTGLEPLTLELQIRCSNQWSYPGQLFVMWLVYSNEQLAYPVAPYRTARRLSPCQETLPSLSTSALTETYGDIHSIDNTKQPMLNQTEMLRDLSSVVTFL